MAFRGLFLFESSLCIIGRKKTEHFKIIKKSIIAAQKCKNILLQAALKDF